MTEDELFYLTRDAIARFPNYPLGEAGLTQLVAAEVECVEQWAGPPTGVSEAFTGCTERRRILYLTRPIQSIVAVIEAPVLTGEPVALTSADYRQVGSYGLARLGYGIWGELVEITYHPLINPSLRARVVLDLVKLDIDFRSVARMRVGGSEGGVELVDGPYTQRRNELLDQVVEGRAKVL